MRKKRPFVCMNCGADFTSVIKDAKYCSVHCSSQHKMTKKKADVKWEGSTFTCPENDAVICDKIKCNSCGWNPSVATARSLKIREKMGVANE